MRCLGWLPEGLDDFVRIPAGKFLYGEGKDERQIPYDFWIGKYPVTNGQYRCYIKAGGYEQQDFWSAAGWCWRQGDDRDLSYINDQRLRENYENWLKQRSMGLRSQPFFWDSAQWNNPIFPVVGVSWFEA